MFRFTVAVLCLVCGALAGENLNTLIDEVFSKDGPQNPNEESRAVTSDCVCVPYYLCQNNSVVTDGKDVIDIRGGDGSCQNYLEVCCNAPTSEGKRDAVPATNRIGCGKHNSDGVGFRITGDSDGEAQFGEFPWMVAVLKEEHLEEKVLNVYQCGGALIHPQVVLTGAHCVSGKEHNYKIRVGEWDTQTNNELFPHQDSKVKEVIVHPDFYAGALHNNIALLFLEYPVTLTDNVDVVCLPRHGDVFDHKRCFASGWGKNEFGKEGKYQIILKKVSLPIVPRHDCQEALRKTRLGAFFKLDRSFICAGGEKDRDTCKGDGGSPLVCPIQGQEGRLAQAGIVSWGIGCGEEGTPGVYADVALFREWIDNEMEKRGLDHSYYSY